MEITIIQRKIYELRGHRVMLDYDLAQLYEVETRVLNQAVKRSTERFPKDFMFRITGKEWKFISSQTVMGIKNMSSQIVTTYPKKRPKIAFPYAFTEHGVTMLASVLRSGKAVKMNIAIVRAFIALRQFAINYEKLYKEIKELKEITGTHNIQLTQIYDVLENIMDEKAEERKWADRNKIGFKPDK